VRGFATLTRVTRTHGGILIAVALAALAGCSSTPEKPAAVGTTRAAPVTSAAAPATTAAPRFAEGTCRFIDKARATTLLGGTPKVGRVSEGSGKYVHVDACAYQTESATLSYAVNDVTGSGTSARDEVAKTAASIKGMAGRFAITGPDASAAYTAKSDGKTGARVLFAKGTYVTSVYVLAADEPSAQTLAREAVTLLLTALG
jgi:hypothetical protein